MPKTYSDDLRCKLLETYEAGEGSLAQLAKRFRVSAAWAKKIYSAQKRTGQMERPTGRKRGRRSRVTEAARRYLAAQVKSQPDRTLAMLQEDLERQHSIQIGVSQLWNILKSMGLNFKKSRSTPPNKTVSGSPPTGSAGRKKADRSIPRTSSSWTKAV